MPQSLRSHFRLALCLLAVTAAACDDQALVNARAASHPLTASTSAGDPIVAWPVQINWVSAAVGFPSRYASYPASASVQAAMGYDAYHASIGATLYLRGLESDDRIYAPREQHTATFKGNTFSTSFPIMVANSCGHYLEADVRYRAWWAGYRATGQWVVEEAKDSRLPNGAQPACLEEEKTVRSSSLGSGGGSTGCPDCILEPTGYTWCRVSYTYDLNTGEILSWHILYCW